MSVSTSLIQFSCLFFCFNFSCVADEFFIASFTKSWPMTFSLYLHLLTVNTCSWLETSISPSVYSCSPFSGDYYSISIWIRISSPFLYRWRPKSCLNVLPWGPLCWISTIFTPHCLIFKGKENDNKLSRLLEICTFFHFCEVIKIFLPLLLLQKRKSLCTSAYQPATLWSLYPGNWKCF